MGAFLSYSIIAGMALLALYLAYRVFLSRDNQHGFNRSVLIGIYVVSFTAPLVIDTLAYFSLNDYPDAQTFEGVSNASAGVPASSQPIWCTLLIWSFIAGMAAVSAKTVITWTRLVRVIRSGEKIRRNGFTIVVTDNDEFAPFSWMRYVVISRADYDNSCPAITAHELKHIASMHWVDLLIAQAVCIINWFNPAAWLMRDELMLIHEYQADMAVIDSGHDPQEYQMLLIRKAVGARFPSLANSLNHSKLKKRITMMYKEKSGAGRRLKALALVPVLALALASAAVPAVRAAVSTIGSSEVSPDKVSENLPESETSVQVYKITNLNNDGTKTSVVIKGENLGNDLTVSGGTFTNNGKTYGANSLDCEMTDGTAVIVATFPFSEEYEKASMTLTVNGKEIPFDLEGFFGRSQSVTVGEKDGSKPSAIHVNGNRSTIPEGMKLFLDGKEINVSELPETDKIASITIDKRKNSMQITTRK